MHLQRWSLVRTVRSMKTAVFRVLSNSEDYRYRAQIMWGGTLARNALRKVFCHAGFGLRQNLRNFASYQ